MKLATIEQKIHSALRLRTRSTLEIGELLLCAKAQVSHGEWIPWLKDRFALSVRTAQNYMSAAEFVKTRKLKNEIISFLELRVLYEIASEYTSPTIVDKVLARAATQRVTMDDYDSIRRLEEWKQQRSQRLESRSASIIEGAEAQAILDGPPPLLPTTDGEPLKFDSCTPDSDLTDFREAVATLDQIATRVKVAELRRAVTDDELRAAAALLNAVMEFRGEALRSGVDA